MRIYRDDTVLVVVDIQEKILKVIDEIDSVLDKSKKLIAGFKVLNIPILVSEQYPKGLGITEASIIDVLGEFYNPIEKREFSCAQNINFFDVLKKTHKKNVVLIGVESHVCVLQSAIDLIAEGFNVIIPVDCVSSRTKLDKKYAIKRMNKEGVYITTYEALLMELTQGAHKPYFKLISKIIK